MILTMFASSFFSCKKTEVKKVPEYFDAVTLKRKIVRFTKIEAGEVSIPQSNIDKLEAIDRSGNPVYFTEEIAGTFSSQKTVHAKNHIGFCTRFIVPQIEKGDYLIIKAEIFFPKEILVGGNPSTSVDANYRYDFRYSGKTEYIWFIFDDANPTFKIPGSWELVLYNKDKKILSSAFDVSIQ
jgi:hypothetical protein